MNLFLILSFLGGFACGTLLICILFIFVIEHAASGNKATQDDMRATNAACREYWELMIKHQELQSDALTVIAEVKQAEMGK